MKECSKVDTIWQLIKIQRIFKGYNRKNILRENHFYLPNAGSNIF